ncbi:MAG: nitroreductase family protein [candidate division KSB1 bacterium]|nr:nitroreductase family protein [candidate division KSB1 bacterium]
MSQVYDLIRRRRTIRRFRQEALPFAALERIVDAARLAPSGANLQPCEFVVVDDPELVEFLFSCTKWAGYLPPDQGPPPLGQRPTAYVVVLLNRERRAQGGEHDAGAAIMSMILTALEMGIGACWIGSVDRPKVQQALSIPPHCEIDSVLALGYPAESPQMEPLRDSVKYWRDENGVLHVPKRLLKDVMYHNRY